MKMVQPTTQDDSSDSMDRISDAIKSFLNAADRIARTLHGSDGGKDALEKLAERIAACTHAIGQFAADRTTLPPLADRAQPHFVEPTESFVRFSTRADFLSGLDAVAAEIYAINCAKGFWKTELTVDQLAGLAVDDIVGDARHVVLAPSHDAAAKEQVKDRITALVEQARLTAPHNKAEKLMLMVSELGEWLEAIRTGTGDRPCEKCPSITNEEEEAADLFIRLADYCGKNGLRLGYAALAKIEVNRVRKPMHGKKF